MENIKNNINDILVNTNKNINSEIVSLESVLTLPVDYIKSCINKEGLKAYIDLRQQLLHTLELIEILVYDTHEECPKCMICGAEAEISIIQNGDGTQSERLNGEITHWIHQGKIIHDFTCDKCIMKG